MQPFGRGSDRKPDADGVRAPANAHWKSHSMTVVRRAEEGDFEAVTRLLAELGRPSVGPAEEPSASTRSWHTAPGDGCEA